VAAEVRRSLAMFATQGHAPQILYLFGKEATLPLQESLEKTLHMPVTRPTFLAGDDVAAGGISCAAGVGLLSAWCAETVPVNFVKPKEPKPPAPSNHRFWLMTAGGAFVLLLLSMFVSQQMMASTTNAIAAARQEKENIEKKLKGFEQERVDLDALEDWEQGSVPWIDELYQITSVLPFEPPGFHLSKLDGNLVPRRNPKEKEKYQARIVLNAVDPGKGKREQFWAMLRDEHMQVTPRVTETDRFTINLDLAYQPGKNYAAKLELPSDIAAKINSDNQKKKKKKS
jgi:hypothetical protein